MNKSIRYRAGILALSISVMLLFTACTQSKKLPSSVPDVTEKADSTTSARPAFWDCCTPVAGADNLYELKPDWLSDKNYTDILAFDNGLLLVSMSFEQPEEGSNPAEEEYYGDDLPLYQFDYYDLSKNAIAASLDARDMGRTSYQVIGGRLFLFDYENQKLLIFDRQLRQENVYDISSLIDDYEFMQLCPDVQPDRFYVRDYIHSNICLWDLSGGTITVEPVDLNFFVSTIDGASMDGTGLILSGINKKTLMTESVWMDTSDFSTTTIYEGDSLYNVHLCPSSYLLQEDFSRQVWLYSSKDGTQSYYILLENHFLSLCPDGRLLDTYNRFPEDGTAAPPIFNCSLYGADGKGITSFSYNCSVIGPDAFIYDIPVYLEDYGCTMFLTHNGTSINSFLVLDNADTKNAPEDLIAYSEYAEACDAYDLLNKETGVGSSESTETEEDQSSAVTLIPNPQEYDWGELADCRKLADQLGEKYNISIYLGPEVPGYMQGYHVKQCLDPQLVSQALEDIDDSLSCYPDGFFSQLRYNDIRDIRFYLAGALTSTEDGMVSDASGFVCDPDNAVGLVLNIEDYIYDLPYTLNHEISHMIDRRLAFHTPYLDSALFSEETWNSFNPKGYHYLETYDAYEDNDMYDQHPEYFMDSYGTTFPTEDRAQLFGASMANHLHPDDAYSYYYPILADSPERLAKLAYYCECIRDDFDTTGWPDVLPWEEIPAKVR